MIQKRRRDFELTADELDQVIGGAVLEIGIGPVT